MLATLVGAIAISILNAHAARAGGMGADIPLVWKPHGEPTATRASYIARVGSFITVLVTRTSTIEQYQLYMPGCALYYEGVRGADAILTLKNTRLSGLDPEIPSVEFTASSTATSKLYLRTGQEIDIARVMQKLAPLHAFSSTNPFIPTRRTRRPVSWTDKGHDVGGMRLWEGAISDLLSDYAKVGYAHSTDMEAYMLTMSECFASYGGNRGTLRSFAAAAPEGKRVDIDRLLGPETEFLVHAVRPGPSGVQQVTQRRPGATSNSQWVRQLIEPMNLDIGEYSPGSANRRTAVAATPYATVTRDQVDGDPGGFLNLLTPSCSILQGNVGDRLYVMVYDSMSDTYVRVFRDSSGTVERVAVDTLSAGSAPTERTRALPSGKRP